MTQIIKIVISLAVPFIATFDNGGIVTPNDDLPPPRATLRIDTPLFEELRGFELEDVVVEPKEIETQEEIKKVNIYKSMEVCYKGVNWATYMDYRAITNTRSKQYELQQKAVTNNKGYRSVGGLVLIAVHSRYGKVGDQLQITFGDGSKENFVIGDIKSSKQTTCAHSVGNGEYSLLEVIVDTNIITDKRLGKILDYSKVINNIEKVIDNG